MRKTILCGLWAAVVCLMFAVPVYAYSGTANGGNGGLGNGMGTGTHGTHDGISANRYDTRMYVQSTDGATRTKATPNYHVSVYGTGTGSQFLNVNANVPGTMVRHPGYHTQSYENGGYRALETTSSKGMGWGWLGLLGLIGLFGIFSRNPQRNR
ncbi:WGxxGxxG family protein [Cohnella yongneupensis]|uniref:WGxxGxxG family protein n=1 Tax=Cohnella yongneupensis TaxID=425006 RepID=A0ABW0R0C3_9BACL